VAYASPYFRNNCLKLINIVLKKLVHPDHKLARIKDVKPNSLSKKKRPKHYFSRLLVLNNNEMNVQLKKSSSLERTDWFESIPCVASEAETEMPKNGYSS